MFILHHHVTLVWVMRTDQSIFCNDGSIIKKINNKREGGSHDPSTAMQA